MIKRTKSVSIYILAALVLMLTLLTLSVGVGNAWFTSSLNRGVMIVVDVEEFNLKLYQNSVEVYTNKKNNKVTTPSYITLSKEVKPDEFNALQLSLENLDAGPAVYVRFKFKLYACDVATDQEVSINLTKGSNFVLDSDGYYYYGTSKTACTSFATNSTVEMLTGFTVPYSSFKTFTNSETLKIVLIVDCADTSIGFN